MKDKTKQILGYCWSAFLLLLATYFLIKSMRCHGNEYYFQDYYFAVNRPGQKTVAELREEWKVALEMHKIEGKRCYDEAHEKCWWLPDVKERKRARDCLQSFIASLGGASMTGKLVLSLLSLLSSYGIDCLDEWEFIEYKLNWAKYHFDMCDHYMNLLRDSQ